MTPIASYTKLLYLLTLRHYGNNNWSQADIKRLMQTNITGEIMDVNRLDTRGEWYLGPDESLTALDGSATLTNDRVDGLLLTNAAGTALWPLDIPPAKLTGRLYMQGDGNLVLYGSSNTPVWASDTSYSSEATSMLILEGESGPHGLAAIHLQLCEGRTEHAALPAVHVIQRGS